MAERRKYDAQKAWSTRNARAQREHELKMKFLDLLEKDDELKYYMVILAGTGSIAAINLLSGLQSKYIKAGMYESVEETTEAAKASKYPNPPPFTNPASFMDKKICDEHWAEIPENGREMYWKKFSVSENKAIAGANVQLWDEILGGVFGAGVGFSAGILILKAMFRSGPPQGVGSAMAALGVVGLTSLAGTAVGATVS